MRVHKLRADVVHIIGHATHDGVGHCLGAVTSLGLVAPQFLNPFQVDNRHHADKQIRVLSDIDFWRYHRAMEALIEQQVGACRDVFPWSKRTWLLLEGRGFLVVMQIFTLLTSARFGIGCKQRLELGKQIIFRPEMAKIFIPFGLSFG